MKLSLSSIAAVVGGKLNSHADGNREVTGFFTDSRVTDKEKLFLGLTGEKTDGNSFVPSVVESGCAAMTDAEYNSDLQGDVITVADVRKALLALAEHYRENTVKDIPFVGITGSVGKTTTKDMVALALSSAKEVRKTIGNANSQLGLPQTVLSVEPSDDIAVVELGMSYFGEMERIAVCAKPDISVITNIGHSHIENLGSRKNIRNEKIKITAFSKKGSIVLLNGDEPLLREINLPDREIYFMSETDKTASSYAENVVIDESGLSFTAVIFGEKADVKLNVLGRHYIMNTLFALSVCKLSGVDVKNAANLLQSYKSDGKRQFIFEKNGMKIISDCYNASPESMAAALSVLKTYKTRRVAVLGDMLELGETSPELHKNVGSLVSSSADVLITYGELSKNIALGCDLTEKYSFTDMCELKKFLSSYLKEGDTVLFKASNGMHLGEAI